MGALYWRPFTSITMIALTKPSPVRAAISAHLEVIQQGTALLMELGLERYTTRLPLCYHASIGGHVRHIIEHYQSFFHGLPGGEIDYENRPRDLVIETDLHYAVYNLEAIAAALQHLGDTAPNHGLQLVAESVPGTSTDSSVLRELEFLLSHTIHHYALVATMARIQGYEPEPSFGMAPSTLKHLQAQAPCAR